MKKFVLSMVAVASLALTGCTTFRPVSAGASTIGSKKGTSTGTTILGIINSGDNSMLAAANAGNITKVATVDEKITNYAGIYVIKTTIVTGE